MSWSIESVREADVDPAAVFALYADPATWSRWGHNATWARADGPLVEGGTVDVRASYRTVYHCLIRRRAGRALELVVRPALLTIINIYEVEPAPLGARIRHAFVVSGPLASVTRLVGLDRVYQRQLDEEVAAVVLLRRTETIPIQLTRDPPRPRLQSGYGMDWVGSCAVAGSDIRPDHPGVTGAPRRSQHSAWTLAGAFAARRYPT